jgi:hypothetical protein
VPEVATPRCPCGEAPETAAHLVLDCRQLDHQRDDLRQLLYPPYSYTYIPRLRGGNSKGEEC